MEHVTVGKSEPPDVLGGQPRFVGGLEHRGAESAHETTFLDGQHDAALLDCLADCAAIERLYESGIHDTNPQAELAAKPLRCLQARCEKRTAAQEDAVGFPFQNLRLAEYDRLHLTLDRINACPRVAESDWRRVPQGEREHSSDLLLVARSHNDHVREEPEICQVIRAV